METQPHDTIITPKGTELYITHIDSDGLRVKVITNCPQCPNEFDEHEGESFLYSGPYTIVSTLKGFNDEPTYDAHGHN